MGPVFGMLFSPAMSYLNDSQQPESHKFRFRPQLPAITTSLPRSDNGTITSPADFIHDASWLSYLALEQQPRVNNGRAEQSQRCEWKNLVVGVVQTLRWRALPAKGTHLFVGGGIGDSNSEAEGKAHLLSF